MRQERTAERATARLERPKRTLDPAPPLGKRFGRDAGCDVGLGDPLRPTWRGRIHLIALWLAIPSMTLLIILANGPRAKVGAAVYAAGLCSMLTVSVTYHRWVHALRQRQAWRRADHAMIFAAIAGSATPIALIAMPSGLGIALLASLWVVSFIGASFKAGRSQHGDMIGSIFYGAASALSALFLPALWGHAGARVALLFVTAGALYILGSIAFAREWPRIKPAVFSYHEIWHVMTIAAAGIHFAAVWSIAT